MREFVTEEIDALKRSPKRWTQNEYSMIGAIEYWLRQENKRPGGALRSVLHGLVRQAHLSYAKSRFQQRPVGESPWDDRYNWKAGVPVGQVAEETEAVAPQRIVSTVDLTGEANTYLVTAEQLAEVVKVCGTLDAFQTESAKAVEAEVANVVFEGEMRVVSEAEAEAARAKIAEAIKMTPTERMAKARAARGSAKTKVVAVAEGGQL